MADQPRLERGQEGEWVTYLEQTLGYQGIDVGTADGTFDESLEAAVKQFQEQHDLEPDGVVDEQTWQALLGGAGPAESTDQAGDERDERLERFDINDYPLLVEAGRYGEDTDAFRQFLVGRGLDSAFVDALIAAG